MASSGQTGNDQTILHKLIRKKWLSDTKAQPRPKNQNTQKDTSFENSCTLRFSDSQPNFVKYITLSHCKSDLGGQVKWGGVQNVELSAPQIVRGPNCNKTGRVYLILSTVDLLPALLTTSKFLPRPAHPSFSLTAKCCCWIIFTSLKIEQFWRKEEVWKRWTKLSPWLTCVKYKRPRGVGGPQFSLIQALQDPKN